MWYFDNAIEEKLTWHVYIFVYCNPCNLRHHLTVVAIFVNSDTAAEWLQSYSESCRQQRKRKMSKTQSQLSTHYIQIQH